MNPSYARSPGRSSDYNDAKCAKVETAMPTPAIVDFRRSMKGEESAVAADKVVKGEPKTLVKNYFSDPTGQFFAGTWSSGVGKWKVDYTENEFCHLLEGRVTLTSEEGKRWQFNAGDAWVIPAGFKGTWESVEPARKRYAIFEAAKPAS
jgi:uncharacterized cupin superfamily protein